MTSTDLLQALLRANVAAAIAVLAVILLRKPVRRLADARQAYDLWLLPILALVAVLIPARQVTISLPAIPSKVAAVVLARPEEGPAGVYPQLDLATLVLALWLAGVIAGALVVAVLQWRFTRAAAQGVVGPAVVGVIRPRIVMPPAFEEIFDAEEQALVLAHERAHIARHDFRLNGVAAGLQCLFWFNPLIHLAAHLARIDQEMACDETVILRFPNARRAYARALVKAQLATRPLPLGCCWPSGTEHPLEERIAMLKTKTKSRTRRMAAGSALAALCAGVSLAAWAAQPPSVAVVPAVAVQGPTPAKVADQAAQAPKAAPAQTAAAAPAQVCITNACMPHPVNDGSSHSIADAIAKGDAAAVVAMGGSGRDVVAALRASPDSANHSTPLDLLESSDQVGIYNWNGEGKAMLVGASSDGRPGFIMQPNLFDLGPAPANAPIQYAPAGPPPK